MTRLRKALLALLVFAFIALGLALEDGPPPAMRAWVEDGR